MTTSISSAETRTSVRRGAVAEPEIKKFKPVKLWAWLGAAYAAMIIYSMSGWIISGNATPTPKGSDPVPMYMKIFINSWEVVGIPLFILFLWKVMIRPWRREGRIQSDGLFCIAFFTLWWQDPMSNWLAPYFTYNSELINFGNWTQNIPGWFMPHSNYIGEPAVAVSMGYVYLIFGMCIVGCGVMRKAKQRWPNLSTFGLIMVAASFFIVFDLLFEPPLLILGVFSYPGTIDWLTLFHGHYYQFPIYEALLWGAVCWGGWTCLRYFKNDKGETFAERGVSDLKISNKRKAGVRLLAIMGAAHSIFLFGYNIPLQFFIANGSPWPEDIQSRSYFQQNLCGEGTEYLCWGPGVAYPRGNDGAHLDPNGHLVKK